MDTQAQDRSADRVRSFDGSRQGAARPARKQRSDLQNRFIHALFRDIANQIGWPIDTGELHSPVWWKRRCTLQWLIDKREAPEIVTALDGSEDFAFLLPHTSDLNTAQCAELAEWTIAFGSLHGVRFSNPKWPT